MKPWRIETITLDEDEEVASITAVLDAPYLDRLDKLIWPQNDGCATVVRRERGDTEVRVSLDVGQLLALFRQVGNLTDLPEDEAKNIPGCYNSLSFVVYQLMED